MNFTDEYLRQYGRSFPDRTELYALKPRKLKLTTFEKGNRSFGIDAPPGSAIPSAVIYEYRDENSDKLWEFANDESLRKTFAMTSGPSPVGYLFDGLVLEPDLRLWFRHKYKLPATTPNEDAFLQAVKDQLEASGAGPVIIME